MKLFSILTIMFAIVFTGQANAQSLKVGVVDVEKIVSEMPEYQKSEKEIESLSKTYQADLQAKTMKLQTEFENYQKQKSMMPITQQEATEKELQTQQMELQKFQNEKFGQQGELAAKRNAALKILEEKIMNYIEKIAKKEKLNLILNKKLGVLYSDKKFDITYKVLDLINTGK